MKKWLVMFLLLPIILTGCDEKEKNELNENTNTSSDSYVGLNPCTYDGELKQGVKYVNGQYTYSYMQEGNSFFVGNRWDAIDESKYDFEIDGWGVILTDSESTEPITTKLCSSINGKPIISMALMFYHSKAKIIDVSSFDTSNVINMQGMFEYSDVTSLDLSNFDTSKVTNMSSMFMCTYYIDKIDLSNFNTSNVLNMSYMFSDVNVKNLDLSSFDTSNVTDMSFMFDMANIETIEIFDLSNFDTSNVTNMNLMFGGFRGGKTLDLSMFDISDNTSISHIFGDDWMHGYAEFETVYVKNEECKKLLEKQLYDSGIKIVVK